jgi:hypothetical protein
MTITLTREEAQQVLECMETAIKAGDWVVDGACDPDFILYMLRARLAQPEPEPVTGYRWEEGRIPPSVTFTAPPQREWHGLTDEDVMSLLPGAVRLPPGWSETVRAIEAKLRERNA